MDRPIYGCLWLLLTDIPALLDPGPQILPSGSQPFLPGTWKARLPRPSAAADAPVPLTPRTRPPAQPQFWASTRSPSCGPVYSHIYSCLFAPPPRVEVKDTHRNHRKFSFYSYPRVSTDLFTWRAGAFGPQLLSPEDVVIVVPGTGQFQQLLRLYDTCAPVPLCVPAAQGEPCSEHRGQSLPMP